MTTYTLKDTIPSLYPGAFVSFSQNARIKFSALSTGIWNSKGALHDTINNKKYFKSAEQNHLDESLLGKVTICDYFSSFITMESHTLFFYAAPKTRQNVCQIKGGVCDIFKTISQQLSRSQHPA
jgi:hypothetical protein